MPDVLFVCVHNAGRSQMAKAFFNSIAKDKGLALRAESGGTEPSQHVHLEAVESMLELAMDISEEKPKLLTNEMVKSAKRVITMGCAVDSQACPAIFIKNVEDWGLPDPKGKQPEEVRAIRDDIQRRVRALVEEMAG